jgi:DNA-binding transcriptional LysR family regulator
LPWILAKPEVSSGRLTQLLPDWTLPEVPVHAVFPSNKYLTPKVRSFVDHACEVFAT